MRLTSSAGQMHTMMETCLYHDEMQIRGPGATPRISAKTVSSLSALI